MGGNWSNSKTWKTVEFEEGDPYRGLRDRVREAGFGTFYFLYHVGSHANTDKIIMWFVSIGKPILGPFSLFQCIGLIAKEKNERYFYWD